MDPLLLLPQPLMQAILKSLDVATIANCEQVFIYIHNIKNKNIIFYSY